MPTSPAAPAAPLTLTPCGAPRHNWRFGPGYLGGASQYREADLVEVAWHYPRAPGPQPARWFGVEAFEDPAGRIYQRPFIAVVDNFGDLVEVAQ